MNEPFLSKPYLLGQNAIYGASQCRPMHLSTKATRMPSLKEAAGDAITWLELLHSRADGNNFACSIG
jgi:hypothetical protein